MKFNLESRSDLITILAVILGSLLIMSPYLPVFSENMDRDSGVFIYTGKQVLDGKIPYLDVWDHKGPLLYYINAFGLLLGRGHQSNALTGLMATFSDHADPSFIPLTLHN